MQEVTCPICKKAHSDPDYICLPCQIKRENEYPLRIAEAIRRRDK
jgi:hypothetical protein